MEIFKAIEQEDLKELRRLLENGANINAVNNFDNKNRPLHFAIERNNMDIVKELLMPKWNVNINAQNSKGDTPLHVAALIYKDVFIYLLLDRRALSNIRNNKDMTFIDVIINRTQLAATPHTLKEAKVDLIESGVAVDKEGPVKKNVVNDNYQKLKLAIHELNSFVLSSNKIVDVKDSLNRKECVNSARIKQEAALHIVNEETSLGVVQMVKSEDANLKRQKLQKLSDRDDRNGTMKVMPEDRAIDDNQNTKSSPLHIAIKNGHKNVVSMFLRDAKVEATDWTSLHTAAQYGHKDIMELLLEKGANIEVVDVSNCTPLHIAAQNGHSEVVKVLVEKGAKIDATQKDNWTPLFFAVAEGHIEVVKLLLQKGANKKATDYHKRTLLHIAAQKGHKIVAQLLLGNGAYMHATDKNKYTPLYLAAENGHQDVVQFLIEEGAKVNACNAINWTPLHVASLNGHIEVVTVLLEKNAMVDAPTRNSWRPLHFAAQRGHAEIVRLLLQKGAKRSTLNTDNETPLHIAIRYEFEEIVQMLSHKRL